MKILKILLILAVPVFYSISPAGTVFVSRPDPVVDNIWKQLIYETVTAPTRHELRQKELNIRRIRPPEDNQRPYLFRSESLQEWRRKVLNPW